MSNHDELTSSRQSLPLQRQLQRSQRPTSQLPLVLPPLVLQTPARPAHGLITVTLAEALALPAEQHCSSARPYGALHGSRAVASADALSGVGLPSGDLLALRLAEGPNAAGVGSATSATPNPTARLSSAPPVPRSPKPVAPANRARKSSPKKSKRSPSARRAPVQALPARAWVEPLREAELRGTELRGTELRGVGLAPSEHGSYHLSEADAVAWLQTLKSGSVDLVITDPPYESLEKHRQIGTTTRLTHSKSSSNDWFQIFPNSRFAGLFSEVFRVLKKNCHFYLFCDQETMFVAKPAAEAAGFKFWKPLVWDKQKIGMGYHYRARYEFILFFEKGKRKLADLGTPDVLSYPRILNGYPTEKPSALSEVLISQSSARGDIVIDPFMGSGSTGLAAGRLGRHFLGNDIAGAAIDIARKRLQECAISHDEELYRKITSRS